jgi:hypothetical protein
MSSKQRPIVADHILQALSTTTLGLFLHVINLGLGKHYEAFPLENIFPFFKVMYFYSIFIIAAYSFIKLSIGLFLLRLADRTRWRPFLIGMLGKLRIFTKVLKTGLTTTQSLHRRLHNRLNLRHNLPMHPRTSRLGLHSAPPNRHRQMLRRRHLQERWRVQLLS